jgi:hypothetical protein
VKKPLLSVFCLFAFAGVVSPAVAEPLNFKYEGASYTARVTELDGGATRIAGREKNSGASFVLTVRDGRVRGLYGASPISFDLGEVEKANIGQVILLSLASSR